MNKFEIQIFTDLDVLRYVEFKKCYFFLNVFYSVRLTVCVYVCMVPIFCLAS